MIEKNVGDETATPATPMLATPTTPATPESSTPRACLTIAFVALVMRLVLVSRSLVAIDRLFVPDDTYYTLAIARSLARGLGPTVDGVHVTSGFQPLLALLLAPVARVCHDDDFTFRAALAIGAIADAVSVWLLGHLAFRASSRPLRAGAAILASAVWALSSSAIATALNGLETSLSVTCTLGALAAWSFVRSKNGNSTLRSWVLSGTLLGLCLVARVDTVFFVVVVGLVTLRTAGVRRTAATALGALLTVGPWWAYAIARFGTIIPESGAAVREQTLMYKALGINLRDQVAWAAGAVVGPPMFDSRWLREALGSGASAIGFVAGIALMALALMIARRVFLDSRLGDHTREVLLIFAVYVSCIFLFYAMYLPATWFFRRYLVPVHAFAGLVLAIEIAKVWDARGAHPIRARAVALIAGACAIASVVTFVRYATETPSSSVDKGHHGVKGYREPARQILAVAQPGAVIGSFQSGALAWFADGSTRNVVNLDGVVDSEAARAVREHRIASFARSRGVTHLADWEVNVRLFLDRSGDPRITRGSLHAVGEAERQGEDERFVLYEIAWPAGQ